MAPHLVRAQSTYKDIYKETFILLHTHTTAVFHTADNVQWNANCTHPYSGA